MISTKMSVTTALLVSATLIAGVIAASFDSIQVPFSGQGLRTVPVKSIRSVDGLPIRVCGLRLLETLRALCGSTGNGYTRRSDPAMPIGGGMLEEMSIREPSANSIDLNAENPSPYVYGDVYGDGPSSDYPEPEMNWRSPKALALKALAEGKGHQRFRRNIVDECCKRPCHVNHMLKYCGRMT